MASFGYEAINELGKSIKGSIEADDLNKAQLELTLLLSGKHNALTSSLVLIHMYPSGTDMKQISKH